MFLRRGSGVTCSAVDTRTCQTTTIRSEYGRERPKEDLSHRLTPTDSFFGGFHLKLTGRFQEMCLESAQSQKQRFQSDFGLIKETIFRIIPAADVRNVINGHAPGVCLPPPPSTDLEEAFSPGENPHCYSVTAAASVDKNHFYCTRV